MNRFEYKEPEFKVVMTSAQDVLTSSGGDLPQDYTPGQFEGPVVII